MQNSCWKDMQQNKTPDKITCVVSIVFKDVVQRFNKKAEL